MPEIWQQARGGRNVQSNPSPNISSQPAPLAPALRSANVSATRISSIANVEVWPPNSIQLKCSAGTVTVFLLACPLPVRLSAVLAFGSMPPGVGSSQNVIEVPFTVLLLVKSNLKTTQWV